MDFLFIKGQLHKPGQIQIVEMFGYITSYFMHAKIKKKSRSGIVSAAVNILYIATLLGALKGFLASSLHLRQG